MKIKNNTEVLSLWSNYKSGLEFYILKKVKDKDVANDLTHEVLLKVYNACCSDKEIKNVRSWMFQIAYNTTVDYFKKKNKFTNEIPEIFEEDENNVYEDAQKLVKPLIQLLPEKYAVPLQLSDIEQARHELIQKDFIAYDGRLYQVLSLPLSTPIPQPKRIKAIKRTSELERFSDILCRLADESR